MKLTNAEKDVIHEKELYEIVTKAIENGREYKDFKFETFSTGTKVRSYVERVHVGIIHFCDKHRLSVDGLVPINNLVDYKASQLTVDEVNNRIKEMHKGVDAGISEREARETIEGRITVAAARRYYKYWATAVFECDIKPAIANDDVIAAQESYILDEYHKGVAIRNIARKLALAHHTVERVLKDNNIEILSNEDRAKKFDIWTTMDGENVSLELAKLGHQFEKIVSYIFKELGIQFTQYSHEKYKPDFVIGNKWIDAKLSETGYKRNKKNGVSVIDAYEECCESLEIVFLRGNKATNRNITEKTKVVHISHYTSQLPKERQRYYSDLLTEIRRKADRIAYKIRSAS